MAPVAVPPGGCERARPHLQPPRRRRRCRPAPASAASCAAMPPYPRPCRFAAAGPGCMQQMEESRGVQSERAEAWPASGRRRQQRQGLARPSPVCRSDIWIIACTQPAEEHQSAQGQAAPSASARQSACVGDRAANQASHAPSRARPGAHDTARRCFAPRLPPSLPSALSRAAWHRFNVGSDVQLCRRRSGSSSGTAGGAARPSHRHSAHRPPPLLARCKHLAFTRQR